ncbi:hypothetical protein [Arthrobacter methylotrophus]|uniref:hypothetical protein n=1 Tax=Arthrobacter methylotrophus TaxID=121291 RepID=UPI0031EB5891
MYTLLPIEIAGTVPVRRSVQANRHSSGDPTLRQPPTRDSRRLNKKSVLIHW